MIEFDEKTNSLNYLYQSLEFLNKTKEDKTFWKWFVISLYGALYGFGFLFIKGSNYETVAEIKVKAKDQNKNIHKTTLNKISEEKSYSKRLKIISLRDDIFKIKPANQIISDCKNNAYRGKEALKTTKEQDEAIERISNLRHELEHFIPTLINQELLIKDSIHILDVIKYLSENKEDYSPRFSDREKKKIKSTILKIQKELKKL